MKWVCVLACFGLLCFVQAYNDSRCSGRGGTCKYTSSPCSGGRYERGLCGGPSNRRCCIPNGGYDDHRCTDEGGVCQMTSAPCAGSYIRSLCGGPSNRRCCVSGASGGCTQKQKDLACEVFNAGNVVAAKRHPSGQKDNAYPYNNLRDVCQGKQASRSSYNCNNGCYAPGGTTCLSTNLLNYLVELKNTGKTININELAGACHSCRSKHYSGLAVDLHRPNDDYRQLYMKQCVKHGGWALNEATHVHCQFKDGPHPNW